MRKEGYYYKGKRTGLWEFYKPNGALQKEKLFGKFQKNK